ncbi:hypothetical protein DERF_003999 [Dermatophagoides farinae]|nr:hypothetical protein DERF_003999 [Dermatophagoides farinae]
MSRMARLITEIGSTKPPDLTLAGLSYHIGIDPDLVIYAMRQTYDYSLPVKRAQTLSVVQIL